MLKVLFFGQLKEVLKTSSLSLDYTEQLSSVEKLRLHLQQRGPLWLEYLELGRALVAVEQSLATEHTQIDDHFEVAFFPPVTGG